MPQAELVPVPLTVKLPFCAARETSVQEDANTAEPVVFVILRDSLAFAVILFFPYTEPVTEIAPPLRRESVPLSARIFPFTVSAPVMLTSMLLVLLHKAFCPDGAVTSKDPAPEIFKGPPCAQIALPSVAVILFVPIRIISVVAGTLRILYSSVIVTLFNVSLFCAPLLPGSHLAVPPPVILYSFTEVGASTQKFKLENVSASNANAPVGSSVRHRIKAITALTIRFFIDISPFVIKAHSVGISLRETGGTPRFRCLSVFVLQFNTLFPCFQ